MPIDVNTWRELFEAVYEMNSAKDHADFATAVVTGMIRLIPAQVSVFQVLDRVSGRIMTRMAPADPFTPEEVAYYTIHSGEMPLVSYFVRTGDTRARRISDVIELSEWVESKYYRTCLRRLNLPHCLALPIVIDDSIVAGLSFNRCGEDFSQRDCELLDAFGPHFRQAWQRHENPWLDSRATEFSSRRRFEGLGLRPRESEVLYWMTEGKQNREIADILGIRLGTVQEHVAGILDKLGQENRHAATVFAIEQLRPR
jgi:DNA-binding CsgD family transcriptional regulator